MPIKPTRWLCETLTTPPFSTTARKALGLLLTRVQHGEALSMPHSKPMGSIGARCHELRLRDAEGGASWRLVYRIDDDAIVRAYDTSRRKR
jgi:phage-related protein